MLDQLKRRVILLIGVFFFFFCEEEEESIDHLLIHCWRTRLLWDLFLAIIGLSWLLPLLIRQTLLAWRGTNVGRKCKKI